MVDVGGHQCARKKNIQEWPVLIAVPQRQLLIALQPSAADHYVEAGEPPLGDEDKTVTASVAHPVILLVRHPLVVADEQVVEQEPKQWRWEDTKDVV